MMRIVIAPDKFKGSLGATEVAAAIAAGLRAGLAGAERPGLAGAERPGAERPGAELVTIPVADGGEGTVDAAVAAGFERVLVTAAGPLGEPVRASYARRGKVAVIELACVCGLMRLPGGRREPLAASSFGLGEVLRVALEAGARRIILGVGGSASTDGGAGLLQALGARMLDVRGEPLGRGLGAGLGAGLGGGTALGEVAALDLTGLHPALRSCSLTIAADVDNPLTGPSGAAEVYGPQKGATPAAQLAAAGITAVYPLSDLEPDPARCRAEASVLLERMGLAIARDRLAGLLRTDTTDAPADRRLRANTKGEPAGRRLSRTES